MKCISFERLTAYVDGVHSDKEKELIDYHLEFCPSCRHALKALQKEDAFLEEAINSPLLPEEFDQEVLIRLEPYKAKGAKKWVYQLLSVASIFLAVSLGLVLYSSSPNNTSPTPVVPEKEVLYKVEDKGILLEVTHINASPLKIEIFYELTPDEQVLEGFLEKKNVNYLSELEYNYQFPNPIGVMVDSDGQEFPFRDLATSSFLESENSVVLKPTNPESLPDTFQVNVYFEEFFLEEGNWKIEIPVDITESKKYTKTTEINKAFLLDNFHAEILTWQSSTNAHVITLQSDFSEKENERLRAIIEKRGDDSENSPFIDTEISVKTEEGKELLIDDRVIFSNMGRSFTITIYFNNRYKGMVPRENLPLTEKLLIELNGFNLYEPSNIEFTLTEQSKNIEKGNWKIESVTEEIKEQKEKIVTITGFTGIQNVDSVEINITDNQNESMIFSENVEVTKEGAFTIQTQAPIYTTEYNLDIYTIYKQIDYHSEVPLWNR
ncbi:anti-sigma factor family protein [Sutcliffiella rhizosphaerae]|uniref:Anti-sigma-W factor RsiW n=1 Tax=Sutcliffiella rhizosphaerae TaxID=2880967 RepID=A0ABN8AAR4_9BACI|nr:zf-HC2 domain-containing protein [Sutcliffiella rhizosphaerae]CAG9621122.1 hypothetical protein BACCIP111883_01894 [Sutcliffiella rhizosphaerae]